MAGFMTPTVTFAERCFINMKKGIYKSFIKENFYLIVLAILFNSISGIFRSFGAIYLKKITNGLELHYLDNIKCFILLGAFYTTFSYVFRILGAIIPYYLGEKYAFDNRKNIIEHLINIPFEKYEELETGSLQSIIRNDSIIAGQWLYAIFSRIATNICLIIPSLYLMTQTNIKITISILISILAGLSVNKFILNKTSLFYNASRKCLGDVTKNLKEIYENIEIIKTYKAKEYFTFKSNEAIAKMCEAEYKSNFLIMLSESICLVISKLSLYIPLGVLGAMSIKNELSIGEVIMFIYLTREIITPIESLFRWTLQIIYYKTAQNRLIKIYEIPKRNIDKLPYDDSINELKICNLSFCYDTSNYIFYNMSFYLQLGEIGQIEGESGSGKSTLFKVLAGLYKQKEGSYYINGKKYNSLVNEIIFITLENSVFPLSLYDNLGLGNKGITTEECINLLTRLGFDNWIESLSEGIYTQIFPDKLSGGQKQIIGISRALLSNRKILCLDEPFSALDSKKCLLLSDELNYQKQKKIIIITSHRFKNSVIDTKKLTLS